MKYTHEECEKLEGKQIVLEPWSGIVAGCDPDLGISIVYIYGKNEELFCLPGPSTKVFKDFSTNGVKLSSVYEDLFNCVVRMITDGEIDMRSIYKYLPPAGNVFGEMAPCPFK